ncbi:MAG: hypothetical protein ACTSWY_07950 [Promethearchaeota archaeon]
MENKTENSYGSLLKAENIRLKQSVEELQNTIIKMTESVKIFSSGTTKDKFTINDKINTVIESSSKELKIISPRVGSEYADILINKAQTGTSIQLVINDRRFLTKESEKKGISSKFFTKNKQLPDNKEIEYDYAKIYDKLKAAPGIDLINNPNIKFLMVWSLKQAIFSSGWLERKILDKTVLLGVFIQDPNKVKELLEIYSMLLPSFMR